VGRIGIAREVFDLCPGAQERDPGGPEMREGTMREEFLVFGSPLIGDAEIAEVVDSLQSGWIGSGPKVHRFERMLEEYVGVAVVRCLASCTAALVLTLRVLDVGPGDEVLVPSMTFVATVNAVEHSGATPVFVDCDPATGLMDLDAAEASITNATKAMIVVHLMGRPLDMDRVNGIRDSHGIRIVEDAAHALGAEYGGEKIGAHGNPTCYSFYATKNITTAEGGAVATNELALAERIECLALHGLNLGAWERFSDSGYKDYAVVEPGFKYNMTDLHASLGLHQLPQLDKWIERRADLWERYDALLADLPVTTPQRPGANTRHARHLYTVLIDDGVGVTRREVLDRMTRQRIGVGVHYTAVHTHPYYAQRYQLSREDLPVAANISRRTLSLPLSPKVSELDQEDVVAALAASFAGDFAP
jgi:dTDP-4-amino-4,6-dideoxygalactose transaminase